MKKNLKIIVGILVFLLFFGFIFSFINAFLGNPVSALIANKEIKSYVNKTYPDMDLEISKAIYNFKFDTYGANIQSKSSTDTHFRVEWSNRRIIDSYEYDVLNHYTTYERLTNEFSNNVKKILKDEFPYETSIMFADFGKAEIDLSKLSVDMPLDMKNPPLPAYLTIYILSNDMSYEFLSARLIELDNIMKNHLIRIDDYSVVIEEPMPEGEKAAPGGDSLHLYDFPADKIMDENLIDMIKEHQKEYEDDHKK